MKLTRRNSTWHLRKRVPRRFADVEPRPEVWISLKTDSEAVARHKAPIAWAEMLEAWEARLAGSAAEAENRFANAKKIAQRRGFTYLPVDDVVRLPLPELSARMKAVHARPAAPNLTEARALLGGEQKPRLTVTKALALYWTMAKDRTMGKSKDQLRRWENPRKKAVANFCKIVGDKAIEDISADDMLDFREWWMERIEAQGLTPNSANKDLTHLGDILRTVNKKKRLGLVLPLDDLALKNGEKGHRPAFAESWIRDKLLAPGALDGLNTEARCLLLGMINTGYRPSEGACLGRSQIRLDHNIPHISIEPNGRTLKTQYSRRVIPLAGISLEAFRQCPDGFPRYSENDATLSATVNKYLRAHGLRQSPKHTLYSLRHSFEDRMLAKNVVDRLAADLMGHSTTRERYGAGASLEQKAEIVTAIAI